MPSCWCSLKSIVYATGAVPGVATLWRRAGAAAVLIPADPLEPLAAVVGDLQADDFRKASGIEDTRAHPIWVETTRIDGTGANLVNALLQSGRTRSPGFARPATFDPAAMLAELRAIFVERGLSVGAIGLELGFVPVADMSFFEAALPGVTWIDCTEIVARLRMVKQPAEIEKLQLAADLTVAGIRKILSDLRVGSTAAGIAAQWREAVDDEARRRAVKDAVSGWAYVAVGPDGFAPGGLATIGDVVKIDVGAVVGGYSADIARTAVIGPATPEQRQVHDALRGAQEAALAVIAPGRPLGDAHRAATAAMHEAGFATYSRGHFGHSVGASIFSEEWPFIAAGVDVPVEPGMVLAVEAPFYIRGLGGFIVEDQVLVTEKGLDLMSRLPRDLLEIGIA